MKPRETGVYSMEERITTKSNQAELYFEELDIERFVERLEILYPETEYVNRLMTHSWGQKVVRFYDPDGKSDRSRNTCITLLENS